MTDVHVYRDTESNKYYYKENEIPTGVDYVKEKVRSTGRQDYEIPIQHIPSNESINVARSTAKTHVGDGNYMHIKNYSNDSLTWEDFIKGLTTHAHVPVFMDEYEDMNWKMQGLTLGYSNVFAWDIDNNTKDGTQVSIEDFIHRFRFKYVLITTKSHGKAKAKGKDRYRVWIPVKKNILYMPVDEYARTLTRLGSYIGLTTSDDKLDNRAVVMGSCQPKFEPSPKDAYIYVSKYENLLDFEIEKAKGLNTELIFEMGPEREDTTYTLSGKVLKDYNILTADGDTMKLSTFGEHTKCYCPICEGSDSKSPSAMVYVNEGQTNSVYCHKDETHQRFVKYANKNKINNEGFTDETRAIKRQH